MAVRHAVKFLHKQILSLTMLSLVAGCMPESTRANRAAALYRDCLLCHSKREVQRGPILDGQHSDYLLAQLRKFKNGQRGKNPDHRQEALMGVASDGLAEKDLERISRYIAALAPKPYQPSVKGNAARGRDIYQGTCMPCHGPRAEGTREFKTGSLAVLEDWYLLSQLRHFKNGRRGIHPEDLQGRLMADSIAALDDPAFMDVVTYISSAFGLRKAPPPDTRPVR